MLATDIRVDEREGRSCLSGLVRFDTLDRPAFRLEWSLAGGDASWFRVAGDPFLAALLLPAMRLGENLTIDAPVSGRLMDNVDTISDIYAAWVAGARRISITCASARMSSRPDSVGLFFSCGVDSFYSLLKDIETPAHAAPITHLILMYGFDIRTGNRPLFDMIADAAKRIAAETGRSLLTVDTNARECFDAVVGWDFYHGAVLASTALALGGRLRSCTIPSTHAYAELLPWGSDPLLDPLWSTESLQIVHDGCEAKRTDKLKRLAEWPLVLQHLRVCWPDWTQDYNCGRCEKCIRTMIGLHLADVLDRSATFPQRLDPKDIRSIRLITGESSIGFMVELLSALRERRRVTLFEFFSGSHEYVDASVLRSLEKQLLSSERVAYRRYTGDFEAVYADIAACSAFVGMRFHSCVFAHMAGVPCLMIAHHQKSESLARRLQLGADAVASLPVIQDTAALTARLDALITDGEKFRPRVGLDTMAGGAARTFDLLTDWLPRQRADTMFAFRRTQ